MVVANTSGLRSIIISDPIAFLGWAMQLIVQKGLIGFLISIAILFILLILKRPLIAF